MCWSGRRIYDRPYLDCLAKSTPAFERCERAAPRRWSLRATAWRQRGPRLWRASQGRGSGRAGARPSAGVLARRPPIAAALDRARRLMARRRGRPCLRVSRLQRRSSRSRVTATPETYLSFFAPDSPARHAGECRAAEGAAALRGRQRAIRCSAARRIFAKAPSHPLNRHVTVQAGHFDTSAAAAQARRRMAAIDRAAVAPLHQPALLHRGPDEGREQRVRLERPRLQLGMELHADEPGMVRCIRWSRAARRRATCRRTACRAARAGPCRRC